jgi:hypothetical protein
VAAAALECRALPVSPSMLAHTPARAQYIQERSEHVDVTHQPSERAMWLCDITHQGSTACS